MSKSKKHRLICDGILRLGKRTTNKERRFVYAMKKKDELTEDEFMKLVRLSDKYDVPRLISSKLSKDREKKMNQWNKKYS